MSHQVSLRREAYQALRDAKQPNESFSDAILRILREQRSAKKDPWVFIRGQQTDPSDLEKRLAEVERWRDDDRVSLDG